MLLWTTFTPKIYQNHNKSGVSKEEVCSIGSLRRVL